MTDIPGVVSAEDVAEMEKFRKILEGGFSNVTAPSATPSEGNPSEISSVPLVESLSKDPEMDKFKNIMDNFYTTAKDAVEMLVESAEQDKEIKEALQTEKNQKGVKIGKWQIIINEDPNSRPKKVYDIIHTITKEVIARDLFLYEAAHALVRLLNKSYAINDEEVKTILSLEEKYVKQRESAYRFKRMAIKTSNAGDAARAAMFEDRCDRAREEAVLVREQIKELNSKAL